MTPVESGCSMKHVRNRLGSAESDALSVIAEAVRSVSAKAREVEILPQSSLIEDLALDSLDLVAVVLYVQDHFQIEIDPDEIPTMRCVADLIASLDKQIRSAA